MLAANKIFHLRQLTDPRHAFFDYIGMSPTSMSINEQLSVILRYHFTEVFYIAELDETIKRRLLDFGVTLTRLSINDACKNSLALINDVDELNNFSDEDKILFIVTKESKIHSKMNDKNIERFKNLFFYFSPKISIDDNMLSCREVRKVFNNISHTKIKPYPGINVFEPRAPADLLFYPRSSPLWTIGNHENIEHSIIIPVYGQKKEVLRTIERLLFQTTMDSYEVIVVDDGDNEDLSVQLQQLLSQKHQIKSFKYLVNPRIYPRRMGDHRFRAGISRNFAVQFAMGNIIHFLDADVLVPRTYLDILSEDLVDADLVQIQRLDLTQDFTNSLDPIEEINHKEHVIFSGRDYWYSFFEKGEQWMSFKCPWKYVCTYGISMRMDYLRSLGGVRTNYIFYGFEDTDLGYRVWRSGGRLKLSAVRAYHQFHEERRSEFKNSNRLRRKLMSQSGKLFFLNHLDPVIYDELIDYLFPRYSLREWAELVFLSWWRRPKKINPEAIPSPFIN